LALLMAERSSPFPSKQTVTFDANVTASHEQMRITDAVM